MSTSLPRHAGRPGLALALGLGLFGTFAASQAEARDRGRGATAAAAGNTAIAAPFPPRRPTSLAPIREPAKPPSRPIAASAPTSSGSADGRADGSPADPSGPFPMGFPRALPSACLASFAASGAEAMDNPADTGSGDCAVEEPVTFRRIRTADGSMVALDTPLTLRCSFALEVVRWVREDLVAIAASDSRKLSGLARIGGHACRGRNRVVGARLSEHATGNALDLGQLLMQDGGAVPLYDREPATKSLREAVRKSACARFNTVLGPGADAAHHDHLHVDLRQRGNGYRMCQWTVE